MYAQDWNLTIQRQITSSLGLEVAYVGMKATHLQLNQNINQPFVTGGVYGYDEAVPDAPLHQLGDPQPVRGPHRVAR